eukprot:jgi/Undpi1/777/HiC_scaffold_10.g04241.m1
MPQCGDIQRVHPCLPVTCWPASAAAAAAVVVVVGGGGAWARQGVGQTTSFLGDSAAANAAAARIFAIVDRKPVIDSADEGGQRLLSVKGRVELRKVRFRYPARPDAIVFRDFKLRVEAGSTVALVGASGNGKSTVINLLLRFYDPESGAVLLDGVDIRTLNLACPPGDAPAVEWPLPRPHVRPPRSSSELSPEEESESL